MLRAVADARGCQGKPVPLSHGATEIGRADVAAPHDSDIKLKVSRKQLRVTFSSDDKTASVIRIGGALSHLLRADGGETVLIWNKSATDLRPGDQLWILANNDATYGGYVFEPAGSATVPASPAAPAARAPIASENSVGTPSWQKHMYGGDAGPSAVADPVPSGDGSGGRGSGGRGGGKGGGDTCYNCNKTGHWSRDCPEKRGKGSGGGSIGGGGGGGGGSGGGGGGGGGGDDTCHNCSKAGHWARDCPEPKRNSVAAMARAKEALDKEAAAVAIAEAEAARQERA